jgi:hypothetical protein
MDAALWLETPTRPRFMVTGRRPYVRCLVKCKTPLDHSLRAVGDSRRRLVWMGVAWHLMPRTSHYALCLWPLAYAKIFIRIK